MQKNVDPLDHFLREGRGGDLHILNCDRFLKRMQKQYSNWKKMMKMKKKLTKKNVLVKFYFLGILFFFESAETYKKKNIKIGENNFFSDLDEHFWF